MDLYRSSYLFADIDNEKKIPDWILVPSQEQLVFKVWMLGFFIIVPIELLVAPFLVYAPQFIHGASGLFWTLDIFWLISIGLQFITMRKDLDSYDVFDITLSYVKSEFPFDFVATFLSMVSNHSRNFLILRSLRVIHLGKL